MIEFYNSLQVEWSMLIMMMVMSIFIAIFHTIILSALYRINIYPKWLFFILNPSLIGVAGLLETNFGALVFGVVFLSVFVLGIVGMIYSAIREGYEKAKEIDKNLKESGKKGLPIWKKILYAISGILFFGFVLSLGVPYFIILFFIILPFIYSLKSNNKKRFYKFQRTLPTANIRSVAMGLAEISGNVNILEPILSRIKGKECAGFLYTIENVTTDDDGKDSYSLEFSETICNTFEVEDSSGKIKVLTDNIEFIDFEIDEQYRSSNKRYTQYLLKEKMNVLLIGKASIQQHNEPTFTHEEVKDVFGIAPTSSVENYNTLRPLLQSAGYFIYFWVILIAFIFITPISLSNNKINVGKIKFELPFQKSKSVKSVTDFYDNVYDSYENKEGDSVDPDEATGAELTPSSLDSINTQ